MKRTTLFVRRSSLLLLLTTNNASASNVKRDDENLGADMDKYMAMLKKGRAEQLVVDKQSKAPITVPATKSTNTPTGEMPRRPSIGKKVSFAQEPEINVIPPRESNTPIFYSSKNNFFAVLVKRHTFIH